MTKKTFFALFGKKRPSVKSFYELLAFVSAEVKEKHYRFACFLFINDFACMPVWYKVFLVNLVKNDLQRFYNYLMETSGFSALKCEAKEREALIRVFHLLTANRENVKSSYSLVSFFMLLSFDIDLKISSLEKAIRQYRFTPETFFEVAEYVGIFL